MNYDPSLIETKTVVIGGKEIPVQIIPPGMRGPNKVKKGPMELGDEDSMDDIISLEDAFSTDDTELTREFHEYVNEGEEPDSDEVRAIKEDIEKEQFDGLLDEVELDYEIALEDED